MVTSVLMVALCLSGVNAQDTTSLNELFAICKKAQSQTEDNGKTLIMFVQQSDPRYFDGVKLYNEARSSFEEWIEYYTLEMEDLINRRDKKVDEAGLKNKITTALEAVQSFDRFAVSLKPMNTSNPSVARNYTPGIGEINTCFNSAVGFMKIIMDAKREKQLTMKKDLVDRLSRYHIMPFSSLK
ncbi:MAG: hypothetical protein IPM91_00450 [Bacteroidetes bacterium]|nr:hypothetical protein [Bacteroidota bacterium]